MTQYLDWKVGDRVVCVDADNHGLFNLPLPRVVYGNSLDGLTKGQVYTIRKIGPDPESGLPCVWLDEIVRRGQYHFEVGFAAARFRRVQPRKTSIAVFERLLLTQNNEVETA